MNNQLFSPVRMQPMGAALKTVAAAMATVAIALSSLHPSHGQEAPPPENQPAETPASPTPPAAEPVPESPPAATPAPPTPLPVSQPPADEPQVLIAEVVVEGATPELEQLVYQVIRTRPGSTTTRTQLQEDTNAIFATGFFADVNAVPSDTPLGVRITFVVRPYPVLRAVQVAGNQVLTPEKVNEIFAPQIGRTLNLRELQSGIEQINRFYRDNGYILGQVVGTPQVDPDGVVTLQVAEGVVEQVTYRFLNKEGEPTKQRTRDFVISREMDTQPGVVLNQNTVQADLRRLFELGLFEDVQVALEPGQDPRKVNLILNIKERNTGSISAGAGYSSAAGLFGTVAFQQNNLFGRNWKFGVEAQGGTEGEFLFDINFTDPWIKGDPYRTSYTVSAFNRLTVPTTFTNGPIDVRLPNGDFPRINRLGSAVFFTRPFTKDRDQIRTAWTGSLGLQYQRVTSLDSGFSRFNTDASGNCLTFPDNGVCRGFNDLFTVQAAILRDLRNDPLRPTSGQVIRLGVDQSIPVGAGNILMNRVRGSYSFYIPVKFLRIEGPQTLAFNIQAGNIFGDLPPYESFTIGGANSVRGWEEGAIGSGRAFVQGTIEYRFPIFNIVGGALFVDGASLLGTQRSVPGQPGIVRGKPGEGLGYGAGLRVNTPLGNIRIDFGWNNEGGSAFSFGIGERF
ncbi:BamA/TamA family outer membrane protein [Thermosynechococcus sp. PP45]|uniref:BamA/TamA family outer membrane protein n=1 Tax=unclassified Thermosynechococcus TaxID=2622553 RepID=UPI002673F910|nr:MULTISPECIES: BamA/TamA family outer membrane protein [unclassified Thermosynechococcus]WKT80946.1 BamA/TamA family outer membrane protein [Thermosynechococcus sp. PP45]WNC24557.1 BamA/TamA family outer membrane protein [Thermosynechococcus sp. PP551]WNC27135.1 BamA/TamA family outer membrane protein [Thermosynechococcus sp. PP555]